MLSIIIVTYKSNERTIKYVREELPKVVALHKVVLVNNGAIAESNQQLADALHACVVQIGAKSAEDSNVYVINNPENSGFAKGNNIGARFAIDVLHSEYLLFSNNDIRLLDVDVVDKLLMKLVALPDAGIIGPRIVGLKGEAQSPEPYRSFWDAHVWMFLCTPFYSKEKKSSRFQFNYSENATEGYHYKLMGSFFMVRSNDFEQCGMMDEHTFLYAEEMILTERMQRVGLKPYYFPAVSVLHEHGATTCKHLKSGLGPDMQFESNCYYYKTYMHTPLWQLWIGKLVHVFVKFLRS